MSKDGDIWKWMELKALIKIYDDLEKKIEESICDAEGYLNVMETYKKLEYEKKLVFYFLLFNKMRSIIDIYLKKLNNHGI